MTLFDQCSVYWSTYVGLCIFVLHHVQHSTFARTVLRTGTSIQNLIHTVYTVNGGFVSKLFLICIDSLAVAVQFGKSLSQHFL